MHLASINTAEEQKDLQDHIQAIGELSEAALMVINLPDCDAS